VGALVEHAYNSLQLKNKIYPNRNMKIRPDKLAAVPERGLAINTAVDNSIEVDAGATNKEKERPKKRPSSLNPTISTTITMMGDDSSTSDATSAGTSTSTSTAGEYPVGD
jgi:hypothetical protein